MTPIEVIGGDADGDDALALSEHSVVTHRHRTDRQVGGRDQTQIVPAIRLYGIDYVGVFATRNPGLVRFAEDVAVGQYLVFRYDDTRTIGQPAVGLVAAYHDGGKKRT